MQYQRIQKILQDRPLPIEISRNLKTDTENYSHNCENIIGSLQVPVGVAGLLQINNKSYVLPIATTEAVLVASINRGCKVIAEAGGAKSMVQKIGITRAPVYKLSKSRDLIYYKNWFKDNTKKLQELALQKSRFTKILKITPAKYKGLLYVKFHFDTADAMGMNMATIACEKMNELICPELKAECIAISSNFCSDKKPSLVNIKLGRGYRASASIRISSQIIENTLKTTLKKIKQSYTAKIVNGSKLAKSICMNSHQANIVAGIFLATGQDVAHIGESSLGKTVLKFQPEYIDFRVEIPSIVCGTVGGGTKLPTQNEAIKLIGLGEIIKPGDQSLEFASVIAGAVLAGEISLLASISQGTLALAHENAR